ncbi:MAG: TlyA family RNA methyltransferase [Clostridia bacterium]|nr:TlyA family RNA methyltransferase [Clostridia bacterium]
MRLDAYVSLMRENITRSRAKSLIESGNVKLDGNVITKPSYNVDGAREYDLEVSENALPFVSRGGLKLLEALRTFGVDPTGKVCIDIGASTGGFTDCLLSNGASKVYAIDSGSGQLSEKLKSDPRVISMERFNARNLTPESIGELCLLAVADLSFISQTYVLPAIYSVLDNEGEYIGLIKPQFECGKSALNKNGIVKDKKEFIHAITRVLECAKTCGFEIVSLIDSPISGGDGNREFLFFARKTDSPCGALVDDRIIRELIK